MPLELFQNLHVGDIFHFYDKPDTIDIKSGEDCYTNYEGTHVSHPHVAIVPDHSQNFVNPGPLAEEVQKG